MALVSGAIGNFTTKTGLTVTANEITSWANQGSVSFSLGQKLTLAYPRTDQETVNGSPAAFFGKALGGGTGAALSGGPSAYDLNLGDNGLVIHAVVKADNFDTSGIIRYVCDDYDSVNRNAIFMYGDGTVAFKSGGSTVETPVGSYTIGEYVIITVRVEVGAEETASIWLNDTKIVDSGGDPGANLTYDGDGLSLGASASGGGGVNEADLYVLQMVGYDDPLTDQEIQDNIAYLNSEWGVFAGTDSTPPTPGGAGALASDNVLESSFDITYTKATDDTSAQSDLRHYLYTSETNNLTTDAATVEANGTLQNAGGTLDVATLNASNLSENTDYWANVVVEDEAGNKAIYTQIQVTTKYIYGNIDLQGTGVQNARVLILTLDDLTAGVVSYIEKVDTDVNGDYYMSASYDPTKHYIVFPLYFNQLYTGTAESATASTITDNEGGFTASEFDDGNAIIRITGGTGSGQERVISSNTTTQITVRDEFSITPDATSTYEIGRIFSDEPNLFPITG